MEKTKADETDRNENTMLKMRRKKRRRRNQILSLLALLLAMVAVMYLVLCLFAWINKRTQDNAAAVFGENDGSGTEDAVELEASDPSPVRIEGDGTVVDNDGNVIGVLSNSVLYSQEELEAQVADARAQAAADVLGNIRSSLNDGDTVLQALRPLYPDELIVYSGGQYNFVPIDYSLKQHEYDEACLNILESGEYQYVQDGQVVSHKGIDVSKHQGTIDWEKVAQDGVEFAFIRAGYRGYGAAGRLVEDENFEANIEGAKAAGIKVGVYFYSQAINETEILEEAELVLNKIAPYQIDCPVVFDVEKVNGDGRMNALSAEERTALTLLFCQTIENAGYRPMIYHNTEVGVMMLGLEPLENYSKWFAAYSDTFYYPYDYAVWQYSQSGRVEGINSDVDLNISFTPLWEE